MSIQKLRTLLHLFGWKCPGGLVVFHAVSPGDDAIRVVLQGAASQVIHLFPPAWRVSGYRAWLDDSARILIDGGRLGATTAGAGVGIKAIIRREQAAC
jgi:hypothetical protein